MQTVNKMRLSKETYNLLKNFSSINSNILIKPGNKLSTVSPGKNIYAEATIQEDFDIEVGIFDLNKFLGVLSMFSTPDLEFSEKYVDISNGRSSVRYFYTDPSVITAPKRPVPVSNPIITFDLEESNLNEILKASSILQVSDITVNGENGVLSIIVEDEKNPTSNSFSILIDENYSGPDYKGRFNVTEIKFLPGSYKVEITNNIVSKFTHESGILHYCIAIKKV